MTTLLETPIPPATEPPTPVALSPEGFFTYNDDGSYGTNMEHPDAAYNTAIVGGGIDHFRKNETQWRSANLRIPGDVMYVGVDTTLEDQRADKITGIIVSNPKLMFEGLGAFIEFDRGDDIIPVDKLARVKSMTRDLKTFLHGLALRNVIE